MEAWPARDWSRQEPDLSLFFLGLQGEIGHGFWPFLGSLFTWGPPATEFLAQPQTFHVFLGCACPPGPLRPEK